MATTGCAGGGGLPAVCGLASRAAAAVVSSPLLCVKAQLVSATGKCHGAGLLSTRLRGSAAGSGLGTECAAWVWAQTCCILPCAAAMSTLRKRPLHCDLYRFGKSRARIREGTETGLAGSAQHSAHDQKSHKRWRHTPSRRWRSLHTLSLLRYGL